MMSLADNALIIAGRSEAGRILCSPRKRERIRYLISIGGESEPPPAGFKNVATRLRLLFEDEVSAELRGPRAQDIERLVGFAKGVDLEFGRALVQCQAGISRSAAAAVILLRVAISAATVEEIFEYVRRVCPSARHNREMLRLADAVLGGSGLLESWTVAGQ